MPKGPVLVVDDDTVSRHVLCQALASAHFTYVAVGSGAEALQKLDEISPSIVLLDLVMPPPDGYQVLRILRSRAESRDLPVVVLTALDAENEIERAFEAGADDFVRKPFKPVELVARIRGQLRLRGVMDQLATREKDSQVVLELTQALASNLDFRGILFTVVQRIAEVAKVSRVSIVLVREQGDIGYVVASSDDEQLRDLPIQLPSYPEIRHVLDRGDPLILPDAEAHPLLRIVRRDTAAGAFRSVAVLPIVYEGRTMGVLFLRSTQPVLFGEHEVALCKTVASAMAIALRNARVLQSLRDQTQEVTVARFEAERRMRSLQRYADFFESSADGIVVVDAEGKLLFANPRAREISGFTEEELRGRRMIDLLPRENLERARHLLQSFARGDYPQGVDIKIKRKDGVSLTLSVNFNPVMREDGVVLSSFRDVTAERAVEAELVKTRNFLQRVIDSSVDAIISADMEGRVLLFNRAAERTHGRTVENTLGSDVRQLYPPGVAKDIMQMIRVNDGRIEGIKTHVIDVHGELIPISLSAALLYEGDVPIGSVGIFTDLREKVRMERRLAEAQEQILAQERQTVVAELAGAAAHELNQPLTSVMGYAELLKRRLEPGTPSANAAEVIFEQAERMAEIVRKIGKITRYETKSYIGHQRILDLDKASDDSDAGKKRDEPSRGNG